MQVRMSVQEKIEYLANVLSVAAADGDVSREETLVLGSIMDRLGATEMDVAAARRLVRSGRYALRAMNTTSHQMANVKDMVMMALADNQTAASETGPIEQLSARLRYSQADMDMVVRSSQGELRKIMSAAGSKPVSRQPLDSPGEQYPATPPPPLPPAPAGRKRETVPEPPAPPPERPAPEPSRDTRPAAPEPWSMPEPVPAPEPESLSEPVPEPVPAPSAAERQSSRLERCIRSRSESPDPREYCYGAGSGSVNCWGCRLADMDWKAGSDWLRLGSFRDDETFVFDKQALEDRLNVGLAAVRACPHLDSDCAQAALAVFPERASVWGRWQYRIARASAPGARTVKVREYRHGCAMTITRLTDGVDPTGVRDAIKIVRRAVRACGRPLPDLPGIVKGETRRG